MTHCFLSVYSNECKSYSCPLCFEVRVFPYTNTTNSLHADLLLCSCSSTASHRNDFMTSILLIVLGTKLVWQQKQWDVTRTEFSFYAYWQLSNSTFVWYWALIKLFSTSFYVCSSAVLKAHQGPIKHSHECYVVFFCPLSCIPSPSFHFLHYPAPAVLWCQWRTFPQN